MTNQTATESGGDAQTSETSHEDTRDIERTGSSVTRKGRVVEYVELGALAVLALLGVVAVFGAYASGLSAVDTWVADEYRSVFRTVFNLVVLGVVGIGMSILLRRRFGY
ncbi:hypothetical protein HLRTI_002347 [Halorhabdus tiamatea SARL4B]|uniref:DUF8060 domain-containing protein n=1 Tax=Halorhabdus tiamatea SARL4B TaxID=1033806 RepID=F7PH71_9EURY|nr:hypothetical protein [Halorhabdus tiamatea]ERJ05624.1 hypothetical protein HLRTI_002347 [Halorhabdus tiamatea SARL4B]CCQ32488.1 hypothetical protein HTIA_0339 [Halorhabdus tiamatea SARL4B]